MEDSDLFLQKINPSTSDQTSNNDINSDPLVNKLPLSEQLEFSHIKSYFQLADDRNKRNFGMSTFVKHLNLIHHFVVRDDGGDALRGLVCGILFGKGFLLINTDKLKKLTMRSKSCVNGCFQRLGFNVFRETQDLNGFFSKLFPYIDSRLLNARHWCIRKASDDAPICFIASTPLEISARCGFPNETYQMMTYPNTHPPPLQQQQNNLTTTNILSSPLSNQFPDQMNIYLGPSISNPNKVNGINNEQFDQNLFIHQNFNCNQINSQGKVQNEQYAQQQLNYLSEPIDASSDSDQKNNFFLDIKSLLNR